MPRPTPPPPPSFGAPTPRSRSGAPARWAIVIAFLLALLMAAGLLAGPMASASAAPVSSANARWLADSYVRFLGRTADDGGLDHQLSLITAGGSERRQEVAHAILSSPEGSRVAVRRAYTTLLGRSADAAGEDYWTQHLTGHGILDLRVLLMASDEYLLRAGGTHDAWLDAVYQELLGRAPDGPGRTYWLGLIAAGVPRAALVGAMHQSDEALGRRADHHYQDLLGRAPTTAERAAAVAVLHSAGERRLQALVWSSDEAFEPFLDLAWS
ncbi:MAG: DUF4214 domain-containing protein [Actinomycetota bacterium]